MFAVKGAVKTSVSLWCHNYTASALSHAPKTEQPEETLL